MKAIKLASIFAVSAVAAAVSTTTLAAEPVFKGTAGLEYKAFADDAGTDAANSQGEVNIIGDTGLVYFDLDMEGATTSSDGGFDLDEIYVKTGAVMFGDFDGSLADAAAFSAGVEEDNDDAKEDLGDDLAIRYAVSDSLTIAAEIAEGDSTGTASFAFETQVDIATIGVSGAYKFTSDIDNVILTLGVSVPVGDMLSVSAFYQGGSLADADVSNIGLGLDLAITEEFTAALQHYSQEGESAVGTDYADQGVTEATLNYQPGDIRYYFSYVDYEADATADYSVVGAEASF
ncbi:hypothetical protein [Marinomonas colpomeniae]|uniref:Porin n=1 Tax=Marinomonas colpomeniae TaxID=2774408 RepID=A0ABR8NWS0_9GAMM|nr:hypothetical protein [Marinomonas colpomeniae]MBD5769944.1 hypothetical protein [Marinomonas colpomeniae]